MRIRTIKTKNTVQYAIIKDITKNGKRTTCIYENLGTIDKFISILIEIIPIGIKIVNKTKNKSIFIALFWNAFLFLFKNIDVTYWIKLIIFELKTFTILALISPFKLDTDILKSSGIEVAKPAISPTVFGFKFKFSANLLRVVTKIYFEIKTIIKEYIINFIISKNIISPISYFYYLIII